MMDSSQQQHTVIFLNGDSSHWSRIIDYIVYILVSIKCEMVVVVIGKSRQGFLLNVEAKYVQQSFLFDLGDFFLLVNST